MEEEKINWANDFRFNEALNEFASELMGIFGRLRINFANDPRYSAWEKKGMEWAAYYHSIGDLVFDSEDDAEREVDRIAEELRRVDLLERQLLKSAGPISTDQS